MYVHVCIYISSFCSITGLESESAGEEEDWRTLYASPEAAATPYSFDAATGGHPQVIHIFIYFYISICINRVGVNTFAP